MTTSKEIVLYVSHPVTRLRWLSYVSCVQVGFVIANFLIMPTPDIVENRSKLAQEMKENRESDQNSGSGKSSNTQMVSMWEGLKKLDYWQLLSPKNVIDNVIQRPLTSAVILVSTSIIPIASTIYCKRLAHMITLLPNDRVRFTSFPSIGQVKPPSIELPLRDVSCVQGRKSDQKNFSILKFRGYIGYHLVHKINGVFTEPKLYDHHLGYAKSWAIKG